MLFAAGAQAQDASQLAQAKGCMNCHDVSQAKMGPSFQSIAAQYKGQADAAAKLVDELKSGNGHMKVDATDAELQQLVAYVLSIQ
jgi:cytochrome c